MVIELPANAPRNTRDAFTYIDKLRNGATIDDLKILALVEAIGQELYEDLATRARNPEVQRLLRENGREEMVHAHRLSQAIELLTGTPFPIPPLAENPLYTPLDPMPVTREALAGLAEAEFAGDALYAGVAKYFDQAEVLALFRQSGEEELEHGRRLQQAAALLCE